MTIRTEKRQVGPLEMRADVTSVNAEKRTFDIMWSTGAKVLRSSWYDGQFYEELSMDPKAIRMGRLTSGTAPFLMDHNGYRVAETPGVIESARIENGKGYATVRMVRAGVDPNADMLFEKIADKIVRNVSVGYRTYAVEKTEGIDTKIPTLRAVDWEPYEISSVAMGAEHGAGVRSGADQTTNEVTITHNQEQDTMKRKLMQQNDGNGGGGVPAAPAPVVTPDPAIAQRAAEQATQLERTRVSGIAHACRTAKLDQAFADKLITDGTALDAARALVIDELAKRSDAIPTDNHVRVTAVEGQDERDKWVRGVSASIFEQAGANSDVAKAHARAQKGEISGVIGREFKTIDLDGGEFRGMRFSDIARMVCDRAGLKHRGVYGERLINLALRATTGDFAILLENVTNKSMRASYAVQADSWRRWCGTDSVKDFREANRYMRGAFSGALPVVAEGAEYTNTSIPDGSKISISTEKRGQIITLSREAMINDDMGALVDVASQFGRKAGQSLEVVAYQQLALNTGLGPTQADTDPFFDNAARVNVATGSALSVAAIDADRLKMRAQTFGQDFLDVTPSILLIPVGLESAAKIINESAFDHTSAGDSNKPNPVRGLFSDIVSSPRLTASTTRRYLFESSKSAFKMVFLEQSGEGPTLESEEGFRIDGTQWKARIEFKFNSFDPKLAVTNAGA